MSVASKLENNPSENSFTKSHRENWATKRKEKCVAAKSEERKKKKKKGEVNERAHAKRIEFSNC